MKKHYLSLSDLALQEKDFKWLKRIQYIAENEHESQGMDYEIELMEYSNACYIKTEITGHMVGVIDMDTKTIHLSKGYAITKKLLRYINMGYRITQY